MNTNFYLNELANMVWRLRAFPSTRLLRGLLLSVSVTPPFYSILAEPPPAPNPRREPELSPLLCVGGGIFNIIKHERAALISVEIRPAWLLYHRPRLSLRPLIGTLLTTQLSSYTYAGVAADILLGPSWQVTPSLAAGLYLQGNGFDLHLPLEFRSSIELSYSTQHSFRIGARFYHISNASLGKKNPGTECLELFYAIPLS